MYVSTSLNVFETNYAAEKAIARCKEAGFGKLDLNYWDHQPALLTKTWSEEEAWAQSVRAAAETHNLGFSQMHGPVHGPTYSNMVAGLNVESFLEQAERSLRTAEILKVPWVVFHPTNVGSQGYETDKQALSYNLQFYRRLLPTMEATGVGIALENICDRTQQREGRIRRSYGAVPEQLAELIDQLAHPLFGACWDTGHAHIQGISQGDGLRILGSRLKATHIQDNDGIKDQHLLPYHGTIDWIDVMEGLRDIQYAGDFTYETHNAIRVLPDDLRDSGLRNAAQLGTYLVNLK
jgi:sugar phosphate isomerase/epimerase